METDRPDHGAEREENQQSLRNGKVVAENTHLCAAGYDEGADPKKHRDTCSGMLWAAVALCYVIDLRNKGRAPEKKSGCVEQMPGLLPVANIAIVITSSVEAIGNC